MLKERHHPVWRHVCHPHTKVQVSHNGIKQRHDGTVPTTAGNACQAVVTATAAERVRG